MHTRSKATFCSTTSTSSSDKSASLCQSDLMGQRPGRSNKRNRASLALEENHFDTQSKSEVIEPHVGSAPTKILKRTHSSLRQSSTADRPMSNKIVAVASTSTSTGNSRPSPSPAGYFDVKENSIKNETVDINCQYESDEDQENFNYMQIRMQNMKDNEDFLASIGVFKAKEDLKQTITPAKKTVSHRGLKVKREPIEPLPRRKSLRINRLDVSGNPLPDPDPTSQTFRSLDTIPFGQLVFHQEEVVLRLPEGPVSMKDCVYSKYEKEKALSDVDQFCSYMHQNLIKEEKLEKEIDSCDKYELFGKMSLTEEHVAKVVPDRVFSLDWYPSTDKMIVVAGDKCGHIGFWDVMGEEKDGLEIVTAFKPHVKPVSQVKFSLSNKQKLYSSSYDGTLRCLDFEKHIFDEVFSVPLEDDDLLRDFTFVDSSVLLVAHYSGFFSVIDTRTPTTTSENSYMASKKNLHTIHVNPISSNHFITAGAEATISLWDLRRLDKKSAKSLVTLKDHSKTVSSAYFSPNGQQILSCSADDTILIYSVTDSTKAQLSKRIRHNNCTGRWLTKFRPTWHPTVDNVFVSGSMARPRRIEVFNSTKGSLISCLESDNLNSVCSLNKFHPMRPTTLAGANSSGRLHVFMQK